MAQESSLSFDVGTSPFQGFRWQRLNLRRKIAASLTVVIASMGLLAVIIVYQFIGRALRSQLDQQASVIATNLSDAASGMIMGKNNLGLHALVAKYARLDGVAYVFIGDGTSEILVSSEESLAPGLRSLAAADRRKAGTRSLAFRGRPVYETRMPILEGRAGTAHIGIWGDVAESAVSRLFFPILGLIGIPIVAGIILSSFLAARIINPILWLISIADKMSKGDLDTPIKVNTRDEIGDLARSLERMRLSLKAALARLNPA